MLSGGPAYDVINEKFDTKEKGDETSDRFIPGGDGPCGCPGHKIHLQTTPFFLHPESPCNRGRAEISLTRQFGSI
ncbi:hypothetical protein BGS_0052 [Beggiatoa sp. SS]|nr:hypothetical protein BGS_0052 [Beggiatoa sp. SS]